MPQPMIENAAARTTRLELTRIYRSAGVFSWFECLRQLGVASPVRAVHVIGHCLADVSMGSLPRAHDTESLHRWISATLERGLKQYLHSDLEPLSVLGLRVAQVMYWNPFEDLAELMAVECSPSVLQNVRRRFQSRGMDVEYPELHDLAALFANRHLRRALLSFDPVRGEGKESAWLSTVFYRYSLRHVLTTRRLRETFSVAFEPPDTSLAPDEIVERMAREEALEALPGALSSLSETQRHAVTLYFGIGNREHNLKEVARALETNIYFARLAITRGVGTLAAILGIAGLLGEDELRLARALFVDGLDVGAAAESLGLSAPEMRRRASRIGSKLRASLRARTLQTSIRLNQKEAMMLIHEEAFNAFDFVEKLKAKRVTFDFNSLGEQVALIPGMARPIRVVKIRQALDAHPALYESLSKEAERVDLSALFGLDASEVRTDLPHDFAEWEAILQDASASSLANAEPLFRLWIDEAAARGIELNEEDLNEAPRRIRDSLSAITPALEEVMPWEGRTTGNALLAVILGGRDSRAMCRWLDEQEHQQRKIDLYELAHHRLDMIGKFDREALDLLAECLLTALAQGAITIPGFSLKQQVSANELIFAWKPPVMKG